MADKQAVLNHYRAIYGDKAGTEYFDEMLKAGKIQGIEDEATVGIQLEDERADGPLARRGFLPGGPRPRPNMIARSEPERGVEVQRATGDSRLRVMNEANRRFWDARIRAGKRGDEA